MNGQQQWQQDAPTPGRSASLDYWAARNLVLGDRYQLEECLGRGGMGAVYKARHILLKSIHAIKIINPDLVASDPDLVTRFRQEAIAAAAIKHKNVVDVTDFGVVDGKTPFLVMEFIKGRTLHSFLAGEGKIEPQRALEMIAAIGAGVGAAHRLGIVHRDLKPLNIMLRDDLPTCDAVKVLDFGLAKIKSADFLGSFVQAQTRGLVGSPFYMAPEQWSDEEPDRRADIYSLGVILYQMLAGEVPFKGPSLPSIMKKHLMVRPPTFASLGAHIAPEIEAAVARALEKEPDKRPTTIEEWIEELRAAVANSARTRATQTEHSGQTAAKRADGSAAPALNKTVAALLPPGSNGAGAASRPPEIYPTLPLHEAEMARRAHAARAGRETGPSELPAEPSMEEADRRALNNLAVSTDWTMIIRLGAITAASLVIILGVAIYVLVNYRSGPTPRGVASGKGIVSVDPTPEPPPVIPPDNMVAVPGGTFWMGRNDISPKDSDQSPQWPAHTVTVEAFYIDKTEVSSAEYAQFVRATGHPAPSHWREGNPPAGQERWPVANVSYDDAMAFAAWRSQRDGVIYRLPTEEEWEYAARGADPARLYPWGPQWIESYANINTASLEPVDSRPQGASPWGALNMIGNVWEWTSSEASFYPGNDRSLPPEERGLLVVRGGSCQTPASGPDAVTATSRGWLPASTRDPSLGFRLVREASRTH
jgi:serine/threonine-protein kinase